MTEPLLHVVHAGEIGYERAWAWQRALADARAEDAIDDVLITCSHERVYTAGRHADLATNLRGTHDIPVVQVDRGGDVTYHGPGQVVAYPIVRLASGVRVRAHVATLLEAARDTVASYGVDGVVDLARAGVWVGGAKLVAVGVRVSNRVTTHGIALNVAPDLRDYDGIIPCGIDDAPVTSLAALGVEADVGEVARRLGTDLARGMGRRPVATTPADLGLVAIGT